MKGIFLKVDFIIHLREGFQGPFMCGTTQKALQQICLVSTSVYHNSLSLPRCAFLAASSAWSKTKLLSDSTSLGPDHLDKKQ